MKMAVIPFFCLLLSLQRSFGDEDISVLINELLEVLEKMVEDVSSFAEYKQEVMSGLLEWSPVHRSEKFWKENLKRFEEDDFAVLRQLALILKESDNPKYLEIALFDFGEFVRLHPMGRRIVANILNVKSRIIELMSSSNQGPSILFHLSRTSAVHDSNLFF